MRDVTNIKKITSNMKINRQAFTLIELLVVIAIIGLLASISIISLNNARAKARDAKRVADAKQVSTALELFFSDAGRYPTSTDFVNNQLIYSGTTYLANFPTAPTPPDGTCNAGTNQFSYTQNNDGESYTLSFCIGGNIGSVTAGNVCATPGGGIEPCAGSNAGTGVCLSGHAGTQVDPCTVSTASELDDVRNNLSFYYQQTANIDLSSYNTGSGWNPIGSSAHHFTGSFDGGVYTISNLFINRPSTNDVGLFGYTDGATLNNIKLESIDVTGDHSTGGLVGYNSYSSAISDSYTTGVLTGGDGAGGLVGANDNSADISDSHSTVTVTGAGATGGIAGTSWTTGTSITNCYFNGTVTSNGSGDSYGNMHLGGLVGGSNATISDCYSSGTVTGTGTGTNTGGLVGGSWDGGIIEDSYSSAAVISVSNGAGGLIGAAGSNTTISRSYSTGTVSSTANSVGGLIGGQWGTIISNCYSTSAVTGNDGVGGLIGSIGGGGVSSTTNSYAAGLVVGNSNVGGFAGNNWGGGITNSFFDYESTGQSDSSGATSEDTAWMTAGDDSSNNFITTGSWDFATVWTKTNGNYPTLR